MDAVLIPLKGPTAWPSAESGALPLEGGVAVAFQKEIAAAADPEKKRLELYTVESFVRAAFEGITRAHTFIYTYMYICICIRPYMYLYINGMDLAWGTPSDLSKLRICVFVHFFWASGTLSYILTSFFPHSCFWLGPEI